ncbi:MAG TPA: hypothetical protein VIM17_06990 [Jatrophihabitantaceae bacterium]
MGDVAPWRPETGYMLFGHERDREFAWLPSVPQGKVTARYTVDGVVHTSGGIGYHDHNWGNVGLPTIVHDWYWARGKAGPYSVIASLITAHQKYGYEGLPIFMLARDGAVVADDSHAVRFDREDVYTDDLTGKPVAKVTRYTYDAGDDRYVVTFSREKDLSRNRMIEGIHGPKRALARLARFDGAYLRFTGQVRVERYRHGDRVEEFADDAIWELMYFGHAR